MYRTDFWSTPPGERILTLVLSLGGGALVVGIVTFASTKGGV